jgi:hypothetical protein
MESKLMEGKQKEGEPSFPLPQDGSSSIVKWLCVEPS